MYTLFNMTLLNVKQEMKKHIQIEEASVIRQKHSDFQIAESLQHH
jgi:hypothetical protein